MNAQPSSFLLLNGSVILLIGLITGFPFWLAILRGRESVLIRPWRVAHSTLIVSGIVILIVGLTGPHLNLGGAWRTVLNWSLVISGYGFVLAFVAGAALGRRGLKPVPLGLNTLLFAAHFLGAAGSILGICVLVYGLI